MSMRDIPRSAVGGAVKLTRLPLDIVVSMLPGDGDGSATKPAAAIAVDRFEAALRDAMRLGFIGNVFNLVIPGAVGGDIVKGAFLCREQARKTANRKVRAKVDEKIDEDAEKARLEQLKTEAKALEERERALTAQAEAQRLQDEATKKKAARKRRTS